MKRLTIVVPYRDRALHLDTFIQHMRVYFARDVLSRTIPYRVLIVEQEAGMPFNRGAIKNVGFELGQKYGDYTCFNDVDYLPIWADYSWSDLPSAIVWYGAETRPIAPGRSGSVVNHDLDRFFGAAVLVPNDLFQQVDGYSNEFWGWGYEDEDLKRRFQAASIRTERRRGTFVALDHDNEGYLVDASPSPINHVNSRILEKRWGTGGHRPADGLSTLRFAIVQRREIPDAERGAPWEIVKVRLDMKPSAEHAGVCGMKQVDR